MTTHPELDEPPFVRLPEVTAALLRTSRSLPKKTPPALTALLDETIAEGPIPPRLAALVRAVWDAKSKAPAALKVVAVRIIDLLVATQQGSFGKSPEAAQMRLAFLRELGVEGNWPDPADDPARGEVVA